MTDHAYFDISCFFMNVNNRFEKNTDFYKYQVDQIYIDILKMWIEYQSSLEPYRSVKNEKILKVF